LHVDCLNNLNFNTNLNSYSFISTNNTVLKLINNNRQILVRTKIRLVISPLDINKYPIIIIHFVLLLEFIAKKNFIQVNE